MMAVETTSEDVSSKRHFHWTTKVTNEEEEAPPLKPPNPSTEGEKQDTTHKLPALKRSASMSARRRKLRAVAVSRLRSAVAAVFGKSRTRSPLGLGTKVVGTLFGNRRGHAHFAFQRDAFSEPAFLVELGTPISGLVREMVSGLVRIALECDKEAAAAERRLVEEPLWRTYCNGKKYGFATRRECGAKERKVLKAVEPISTGAGVLPENRDGDGDEDEDGDVMYMRAKFERVVGSRDSEAFYMMNPDSNGAAELSIYLLRV
ncbi:hypothetical protein U1Q18_005093 [Sarracenia purpurea var. burkii]